MAVDFAPPNRPVDQPPGFGIFGRNAPSAPESPGLVDAGHGDNRGLHGFRVRV